jgi:peptide-methionine (S)-S-oxide reductase
MKMPFLRSLVCAGALAVLCGAAFPNPPAAVSPPQSNLETTVLAGGCFWGMEAVFESLRGVKKVVSGYAGGAAATAHYEMVSTGTTGHAESVQITFDPKQISYGELLKVFFSVAHDPTELNRQGPDDGAQYRSAIFYTSPQEEQLAKAYIRELTEAKVFPRPIVTQVVALKAFYPAEAYHQHFVQLHPDYPYVVYEDKPKLEALRRMYPTLLSSR